MARREWSWTKLNLVRAEEVKAVANELRKYWPLTLRQIYYQLVTKGKIKNTRSHYNMLSKLVKWMRIDEMLPWDTLEDRSRTITAKRGYENLGEFVNMEMDNFLEGYTRCLVQGQESYIEVWTEKDALFRIFNDVVWPYCIRAVVCRGYSSVTFIADFYTRADRVLMRGQQPTVLYFGDLDPSGVQMLEATIETLEDELELYGVKFKRVGLNPEHIDFYNLPHDPEAAKISDPRYQKYVQRFGKVAVELDALHPSELENMIREAIEAEIDMDLFEKQKEKEEDDQERIGAIREQVNNAIDQSLPGMFD
jgi:hypothetical protein